MNNKEAYNVWAESYDTGLNKTRDMEAKAIRNVLARINFTEVLEIGCGSGKNISWLGNKASHLTAVDFSRNMLEKAREKISNLPNKDTFVFKQADITRAWDFYYERADLVACSLVLEHIPQMDFVFREANKVMKPGGYFYIGELHPYRQYRGSKAKFETVNGIHELECCIHHISEYFECAKENNFSCIHCDEWFDNDDRQLLPRIISLLFRKND